MNPKHLSLLAVFLFPFVTHATDDVPAPKPDTGRSVRVLLHLPGSGRLIDYPDVYKLRSCEPNFISFETLDGFVVTHHGSYTLIVQKNANVTDSNGHGAHNHEPAPGTRYFDPQ